MTTPIHTAVHLVLGDEIKAQAAFNRSLHAACYGPFNVRNEVDKHADIVGGHFDNSHFLTGDGGFLQAVINGYGGIRILPHSLKLHLPRLPEFVGQLLFRALRWLDTTLDLTVTAKEVRIGQGTAGSGDICLATADGGAVSRIQPGGSKAVARTSAAFPATLRVC